MYTLSVVQEVGKVEDLVCSGSGYYIQTPPSIVYIRLIVLQKISVLGIFRISNAEISASLLCFSPVFSFLGSFLGPEQSTRT